MRIAKEWLGITALIGMGAAGGYFGRGMVDNHYAEKKPLEIMENVENIQDSKLRVGLKTYSVRKLVNAYNTNQAMNSLEPRVAKKVNDNFEETINTYGLDEAIDDLKK